MSTHLSTTTSHEPRASTVTSDLLPVYLYVHKFIATKSNSKMQRLRRLSMCSLFESDADDIPTPNITRISTRVQARLKDLFPAKAPVEVQLEKKPGGNPEPPSEHAIFLATLESLPPLSPAARQYATEMRQGDITFAHVVGEGFSRYLKDGLPGYEEVAGEEKADKSRRNIEIKRDADYEELHGMLIPGNFWYASETWAPGEKFNAPRYPTAICTVGVATKQQLRGTTTSSEKDPATTKRHKKAASWPDVSWVTEKSSYSSDSEEYESSVYSSDSEEYESSVYSSDSEEDEPSIRLNPSDSLDKELQSPDHDSDEEQDSPVSEGKSHVKLLQKIPKPFKRFTILDPN